MKYIPATGPSRAALVAIGEAPGADEEALGQNFIGYAGQYLRRLIRKHVTNPDEVLYLNVSRFQPPGNDIKAYIKPLPKKLPRGWDVNPYGDADLLGPFEIYSNKIVCPFIPKHIRQLYDEIEAAKPRVVLALGGTALWALTGKEPIGDWMGSVLPRKIGDHEFLLIPLQHPAAILRQYKWRFHNEQYFRKAKYFLSNPYKPPKQKFKTRPSFAEAIHFLDSLSGTIWVDIETTLKEFIDCIGICKWTDDKQEEVMCIPFMENGSHYWTLEEELTIVLLLRHKLRTLPIIGQNFFYDAQYVANWFMCIPNLVSDTMITHHTIFPTTEKALDYQSSLYLPDHIYWKHESRENRWLYNCKDCLATKQIHFVLMNLAASSGLEAQVAEQNSLYLPVLKMMLRGVRRDGKVAEELSAELGTVLDNLKDSITQIVGYDLNPKSHKQLKNLFYQQLLQKPVVNRKRAGSKESVDKEALQVVAGREPVLKPLTTKISRYTSIRTIKSTSVEAKPDPDGRLRYSLNIAGTVSFRFASSKAVSGNGLNIQNVKKKKEDEDLPRIRRIFRPDPGYTLVDCDLKNAEFYIMVWESGDPIYKKMLQKGIDIHAENAKLLGIPRPKAKGFIYATDYLASPRTCALQFGLSERKAQDYQDIYFLEHQHIRAFHNRVQHEIETTSSLTNIFGYKITFYDRPGSILPEAVDWIPQSTVAIITDKAIMNIHNNLPDVQMLFQNHDSIIAQVPTDRAEELIPQIVENMLIPVPYSDPLTIPVDVKTSEKSWGEVKTWTA